MASVSRIAFNPEHHSIIVVGIPITGLASGTYLTISPSSDIANKDVGADGELHVNLIADNTSTAKLRMAYDNPSYQLMKIATILFRSTGIYLPSSFTNTDNLLDTTVSTNSHIQRFPDETYSVNAADMYREFTILLHNTIRV